MGHFRVNPAHIIRLKQGLGRSIYMYISLCYNYYKYSTKGGNYMKIWQIKLIVVVLLELFYLYLRALKKGALGEGAFSFYQATVGWLASKRRNFCLIIKAHLCGVLGLFAKTKSKVVKITKYLQVIKQKVRQNQK